jgi:MFS family permease
MPDWTPRKYFAGLSRNTFLLAAASLFADISTEMLYPILPIFLIGTLHASGSVVGLIEGTAQATQNIVQGFAGTLSDRTRKYKAFALLGFLVAASAKPLMGFATVWEDVFAARLLDRIGTGTRSAPRDALVAASVADKDRGRAFGLEGLGDNAGAFLGPVIAVLLITLAIEIRTIFFIAVVPGLLAFAMVLLVRERPTGPAAKAQRAVRAQQLPLAYWKYLAVTALFGLGSSSNSFLILQTKDIGASLSTTILIYAAFNLVAALVSYPAGSLSDRWGRRNMLLAAYVVFFIAYLGLALTRYIPAVAILFAGYGVFHGMFRAVGKAFAADLAPVELRAGAIGWYTTTVGLLGLVASLVAGELWDHVGHEAVFYYGATFALAGGVALVWMNPGARHG